MSVPSWWAFVLLSLAAFRVWKLIGEDTILDRPRTWVLKRVKDDKLELFITCPWCSGFWISGVALMVYCVTTEWLDWFGFLTSWFAVSAAVGIVAHFTLEE